MRFIPFIIYNTKSIPNTLKHFMFMYPMDKVYTKLYYQNEPLHATTSILLFSLNIHDEVAFHSTTIIIVISFNVTELSRCF